MKTEVTTMIMIYDDDDRILVMDRLKKYKGISFPGGHVEPGESIYNCAVREIKEETGLDIACLENCGIVDWVKKDKDERYIEFLFKTKCFAGTLSEGSDEGKIFWIDRKELSTRNLSPNFDKYLPMFFDKGHAEAFGEWTCDDEFNGLEYLG